MLRPWCANSSHSGEHGDGIVRSEFNELHVRPLHRPRLRGGEGFFDPAVRSTRAACARRAWTTAACSATRRRGRGCGFRPATGRPGLGRSAACRRAITPTTAPAGCCCCSAACAPSFRVTRDEIDVTRGRANTLRLALTGQLGPDAMAGGGAEALKLCVACKGCRECPTGVDMAKFKIEAISGGAARRGAARAGWSPGCRCSPWAARPCSTCATARRAAPFGRADRLCRRPPAAGMARRPVPRRRGRRPGGSAVLFADTFNRASSRRTSALRVLRAAGHRVTVAGDGGRAPCRPHPACRGHGGGAPRRHGPSPRSPARRAHRRPRAVLPVRAEARCCRCCRARRPRCRRARHAVGRVPGQGAAHVHGHCHQKSFGAFPPAWPRSGRCRGSR